MRGVKESLGNHHAPRDVEAVWRRLHLAISHLNADYGGGAGAVDLINVGLSCGKYLSHF